MLWVYQTSQRNWVAIKVQYGYLRKCLLGWHESRLGFSLHMMERCLWAHSIMHHHNELNVTKELVTGSRVTERVKRLAGNEIQRGIGIPTIESRASIVPLDKGNCIWDWLSPWYCGSSNEIIMEHVGTNMGIQIPLLVIDQRVISVMSAWFPNP